MATRSELDPRGPDPTRAIRVRKPWQIMAYIEQARIAADLTQRQLAGLAGTSQPTYVGWANTGSVRGHTNSHAHMPRLDNVLALLDALGLDMVIRPPADIPVQALDGNVDPASTPSNIDVVSCGVAHTDPCLACQATTCCPHCLEEVAA